MLTFAIRNLMSRPLRSLLSLLGLSVAIAGMVGLFSVARGLERTVASTFDRIPGLLVLQTGAPIPLFSRLPSTWAQEIAGIEGVSVVNSEVWQRVNLIDGKMIISPPRFLFGTDIASRRSLRQDPYQTGMKAGRFLMPDDRGTANTVISRQIADEFHVGLSDRLQVNGHELTIVGIYECGSLLLDVAIILDIDQVRTMSRFDADSISSVYVEPNVDVDNETLLTRIEQTFRGRDATSGGWTLPGIGKGTDVGLGSLFKVFTDAVNASPTSSADDDEGSSSGDVSDKPVTDDDTGAADTPSESDSGRLVSPVPAKTSRDELVSETSPIEVRSASEWADRIREFSEDLDLFLVIMTSIGVTIAVLSIVNTMLMSVTERFIEFGILKANGWSRHDVLKLITFESAVLGVGGGILGAFVGWVATLVINAQWPDRIELYASPGLLAFGVVFSTVLGILGGLYPAVWAMRLLPMDAIRRG